MSFLFPFIFRVLARLPLPLLHNLGALAGWLAWLLSATYRRHMRANMAQAELGEVQAAAIAEAGKALLELPKIWLRPQHEVVARVVKVSAWELVEEAWASGRGILFLTPHLGCFEITAQYYAARKPMTALYRRPKQDWLAPLIEQGRGANLTLAPADLSGVRRLLKALKRGEAVGMLPDQVPGLGEGAWLPFFGRPAYTMTLAARLAETGATVLLAYAERLHYGAGYHLRLFPLTAPLTGDLVQRATQLNRELETLIRQCPEQYLWGYNRYKVPAGAAAPPDDAVAPAAGQGEGHRETP
ncbi:MAG: lysophospholipid acyltransferase family protein [Burkholderiaceae bacterium]|nr:lysophospholipid acyltransferase family protein [Sulfuritalea sp.]MCF8174613.1 lysophospholipid acyltransferase family protein [Burkholderiaceae bacterium]MCF8184138.1 lysophospholipid acyltransferase family protein [Polynucleobacter sp.]